ncbi:MAG: hypothetical protein JW974_00760 [Alphaproteobacteria bacterium]|nr:hypothetical protein [Alphaproteobacteria bacterium]MBN2674976.1 hypothetical protein [Alphaproteobacteria bacterium]
MSKGWDNATLKKLKALTGKGLSTAEIGKRLGISKNAVVGKLNRLGWNLKAGGVDAKTADKKAAVKKTVKTAPVVKKVPTSSKVTAKVVEKKVKVAAAKKSEPVKPIKKSVDKPVKTDKSSPRNLAMHQRIIQHSLEMANLKSDHCRYPMGDPDSESFHFCGEPVFVGKPYCYEHCKQAYQFTPQKKK